jgi:hypothetical protein
VSLYNSATKTLTEQFYTVDGMFSTFTSANKRDEFLYVSTNGGVSKMRRIDTATGVEDKSVSSWTYAQGYINFSDESVIFSHEGDYPNDYIIKVYDENLALLDSTNRRNVSDVYEAIVHGDRLFSVVGIEGKGYLHVLDLNTLNPVDSTEITSPISKLVSYNDHQLLCFQSDGYFILDTETLAMGPLQPASFGTPYVALSASVDMLYYLQSIPQPALYPSILSKIRVSTGELFPVIEYGAGIHTPTAPILFDEKAKVIVGGGGLQIFSTTGELLDDVEEALGGTVYIFVR